MIKVFYQEMDGNACISEDVNFMECDIEIAVDEEYYNTKTEEEKLAIRDNLIYKIKNLNVGEEFEFGGFKFGAREMSRAELDDLQEFSGW